MTCETCSNLRGEYRYLAHAWVMATDELAEAGHTATNREKYVLQRIAARARAAAENARRKVEWHEGQHEQAVAA